MSACLEAARRFLEELERRHEPTRPLSRFRQGGFGFI